MEVTLKPNAQEFLPHAGNRLPSLRAGGTHVLEILTKPDCTFTFRIIDKSGRTSVWPADLFTMIDNSIPDAWIIRARPCNTVALTYPAFARAGFWEDYFDGDPEAEAAFDEIIHTLGDGRYSQG